MKTISRIYSILMILSFGTLITGALLQDKIVTGTGIVCMVVFYLQYTLLSKSLEKPRNKYRS